MAIDATNRKYALPGEIQNADETEVYVAPEASPGRLPAAAEQYWYEVEVNSFADTGTQITTTARSYFNPKRVEGKPRVTKEEARAGWQSDVTDDQFPRFARGFLYSDDGTGVPSGSKPDTHSIFRDKPVPVTELTTTDITVANTTGAAALVTRPFREGDIVKILDRNRGPNDNRVAVLASGTNATTLVAPANSFVAQDSNLGGVRVVCVGHRLEDNKTAAVETGGIATLTLTSPATTRNFTALGLSAGETIFIGGDVAANRFTAAVNGFATIQSVSANELRFSSTTFTPADESAASGKLIDIYFGSYIVNGSTKRTWQMERTLGHDGGTPPKYQSEVITGCLPNEATINFQPDSFVNADLTFMPLIAGEKSFTDTLCHEETGVNVQKRRNLGGYAAQIDVYSARIRRLSGGDQLFKWVESANITLNNNVTGTTALGVRGYIAQNARKFMATGTLTILFQNIGSIEAIRKNETCYFNMITLAEDSRHAVVYDIPQLTLSGGLTVEQGQDIKQNLELTGFGDPDGNLASITAMLHIPLLADSL